MTPEAAEYHRIMLLVGLRDRFDREFDHALEQETPLSGLILALTSCASDSEKASSVLHSYALANAFDPQKTYDLVLDDIRSRYFSGELSRMQTADIIRIIAYLDEHIHRLPWSLFTNLTYALEEYEDGYMSEEDFITLFDAWFFRGEPPYQIPPQVLAKTEKTRHSKPYWKNLIATLVTMFLGFASIGLTIALTGARDIREFTTQDNIVFCCFIISELLFWGLCFFFANRCGKRLHERSEAELAMLSAHKNDGLDTLPYPCIQVVFDTGGIWRGIIQSWNDRYYVTVDRFFFREEAWHPVAFQSDLESLTDVAAFLRSEGLSPEENL